MGTLKGIPFVARDSSGLFFSFNRVVITCSWTFVGKVFTKPATFSAASDKAHLCKIPRQYDCLQVLQRTETVLTWSFLAAAASTTCSTEACSPLDSVISTEGVLLLLPIT